MGFVQWIKDHILPYWKTYIVVLLPVLLLPLPILATYQGPDDGLVHKVKLPLHSRVRGQCPTWHKAKLV